MKDCDESRNCNVLCTILLDLQSLWEIGGGILRGRYGLMGNWYHFMSQGLSINYAMRALATGLSGDSEVSGTERDVPPLKAYSRNVTLFTDAISSDQGRKSS